MEVHYDSKGFSIVCSLTSPTGYVHIQCLPCDFRRDNILWLSIWTCLHDSPRFVYLYGCIDSSYREYIADKGIDVIFMQTHTRFLPQIMEISSATDQIYGRFLKMCKDMEHAKNIRVHFLTNLNISTLWSIIGSNLRTMKKRLHMNNLATLMDEGCKKLREAYWMCRGRLHSPESYTWAKGFPG